MFNFSFYHGPFFCIEAIEDHQLRISSNILASQIMTWMALMLITPKNCPNEDGQNDGLTKKQANYHEMSTKNTLHTKKISWQIHASIREKRIMTCHHVYNAHLSKKYTRITHPWPLSHRVAWILRTEVLRLQRPKMHRWSWCLGLTPMRWEKVLMDNRKDWMMNLCVCVCMFFFWGGGSVYLVALIDCMLIYLMEKGGCQTKMDMNMHSIKMI